MLEGCLPVDGSRRLPPIHRRVPSEAADHFAIERVASIRGSTVGDKELRARILEAYGFASLSLAQELGRPGFVRPDEFVADLLAGIFSPEELSTAAAAAVERYMTGAAA